MMHWIYKFCYVTFLAIAICVLNNVAAVPTPLQKTMCSNELKDKCSLGLSSHCIPDENDQYKHICSQWKWIPKDRCPYYNSALQTIDSYPCDIEHLRGCPRFFYKSHNLSEFDACYLTLYMNYSPSTTSYVTDIKYITPTDKSEEYRIPVTRYENYDDVELHIFISVGVCIVTALCVIVVLCYLHRINEQLKKNKGYVGKHSWETREKKEKGKKEYQDQSETMFMMH